MIIRNLEHLEVVTKDDNIEGGYSSLSVAVGASVSVAVDVSVKVKFNRNGYSIDTAVARSHATAYGSAISFGGPARVSTYTNAIANANT